VSDSDWLIPVICTDRGQHTRLRLADVRRVTQSDGSIRRSMTYPATSFSFVPPEPDAEPSSVSRTSYRFYCPGCGRHPSILQNRWWDAMWHAVTETDVVEIDISLLPF